MVTTFYFLRSIVIGTLQEEAENNVEDDCGAGHDCIGGERDVVARPIGLGVQVGRPNLSDISAMSTLKGAYSATYPRLLIISVAAARL